MSAMHSNALRARRYGSATLHRASYRAPYLATFGLLSSSQTAVIARMASSAAATSSSSSSSSSSPQRAFPMLVPLRSMAAAHRIELHGATASIRNTSQYPLFQLRMQSTQTQQSASNNTPLPPLPSSSSRRAASAATTPKVDRPASVNQAAESKPRHSAPTSDISRVVPASPLSAAEKGSAHNQSVIAASDLAERQAIEKAEEEQVERERKEMGTAKRVWLKVKEEAQHYWHGTKLLGKEMKISGRLLRRLLMGYSLTRREQRQLKRTTADLLRLIPFAPFIIIPFGELLLPVVIKIFPNMLPSTFESKFAVEEKRRGLIKVRLEMAKFLQGTIREGGIQATDKVKESDAFKEFFRKVRATGEQPSSEDIIKVAKLFDDDVTLDNLTRPQLVSMCRYMQINAFGTDNYLRYQVRHKLNRIKRDDIILKHEGLDHLSMVELQSACQSRGIQTLNLGEDKLRDELRQWIELHSEQRISGTLLILSKAFNYMPTGDEDTSSQLRSLEVTLSSLPDNLISEAELNVSKDSATNKQRLEVLQQQEELIEDEAEQEAAEEEARKVDKKRRDAGKSRLAKEEEEAKSLLPKRETQREEDTMTEARADELRMTNEQLTELGEALSLLSAKSSVLKEREELAQLIKEVSAGSEDDVDPSSTSLDEAAQAVSSDKNRKSMSDLANDREEVQEETNTEEAAASPGQSAASRSLAKRVRNMLEKIDEQLEEYEKEVGSKMHIIEASPTGKISVDDLGQALRLIKHRPSEDVLERLVDSMDTDKDGLIPLQEVVALAQEESGLGIVREDSIQDIRGQGRKLGKEARGGSLSSPLSGEGEGESSSSSYGEARDEKSNRKSRSKRSEKEEKALRREDIVKDD